MDTYRQQKERLEYEALMRSPESAYLVSNEEFDIQFNELGWTPSDIMTMTGNYFERGMYSMKQLIRAFFIAIL